jgi:hypothetical protein
VKEAGRGGGKAGADGSFGHHGMRIHLRGQLKRVGSGFQQNS